MALYRPSELKARLQSIGTHAKKLFSQNFLIDGNIVQKILSLAKLKKEESVLEIGPGPGVLSEAMIELGAKLVAVEKDRLFAEALPSFLKQIDEKADIKVLEMDILDFNLDELPSNSKVIANLPYHLTTPILTRFLPLYPKLHSLTVMVQEEVARRLCAKSGSADFGSLSIFARFYSTPTYGFKVARNCFSPAPKVDSAVVHFELKKPPEGVSEELFFQLVRTAFGKRRKMLKSSLKELYPSESVEKALETIGKPIQARPEELNLEEFLTLLKLLND